MREASKLAHQVIELAIRLSCTIGTAESLTAGMIASTLAQVPGASRVLMGGIVSYDPRIKRDLLGVPQDVIDGVGVVSQACALQMARGARECLGVQMAVSATGLAGPGGGTKETPVGTVFLGVATQEGCRVEERHFPGDRQDVREQATQAALEIILHTLQQMRP